VTFRTRVVSTFAFATGTEINSWGYPEDFVLLNGRRLISLPCNAYGVFRAILSWSEDKAKYRDVELLCGPIQIRLQNTPAGTGQVRAARFSVTPIVPLDRAVCPSAIFGSATSFGGKQKHTQRKLCPSKAVSSEGCSRKNLVQLGSICCRITYKTYYDTE
jgi:hypothetical protein